MTRVVIKVFFLILPIFAVTTGKVLTNGFNSIDANTSTVGPPPSKSPSFVVSIQEYTKGHYKHLCGGTIIDEQFVISAAHCVLKPKIIHKKNLYVVGGSNQLFGKNSIRFPVIGMATHNRFKFLKGYDILLLRVSPKFSLDGKQFSKINFKDFKRRSNGLDGVLLGWGRVGTRPYKPKNLESVTFKTIDNGVCLKKFRFKYLTETEICAVHTDKKTRGACDGDSGGPLVDLNKNVIYGLLSYGRRACESQKPYAFTRISTHVDWIQQQMSKLTANVSSK